MGFTMLSLFTTTSSKFYITFYLSLLLPNTNQSFITFILNYDRGQCIKGQLIAYATLFVDGIHGIAVSYVFCYRTPEGREVLRKWWENILINAPSWLCCRFGEINRRTRRNSFVNSIHRSNNQSSRSSRSICNDKDTVI